MATPMGPPPPKTSSFAAVAAPAADADADAATSSTADLSASSSEPPPITTTPTAPPPPQNPNPSNSEEKPQLDSNSAEISPTDENKGENNGELNPNRESKPHHVEVPYTIPLWSHAPSQPFFLEVLKDGSIIDQLDVTKKGAYMFGRVDLCDFVLEHSSISRFHAVLQFKGNGDAFIYDLGSTHGTFINKSQVKKKVYVELHVGDVIRFGLSSRMYIFQGPEELMPPEADLNSIKYAKLREEKQDREASLRRAREEAALADGISWGMSEDAIEEAEDDPDEITWQTYKGELTEKQQKTREKVLKRMEKIAHMKKEIAAIRAKDISQGGLTQGQQTQIARNEMRISQIAEELESLEETLNDSIQESIGARAGKLSRGKNRGAGDDEEDFSSDDDEFYDRTKKKSSIKSVDSQSVETADSLLEKKDTILKEMEEIKKLLLDEKNKISTSVEPDAGDALDAFMSGLSSRLVLDKTVQLEKELSTLQTELDRILYLLQIADPTGEAAKKWQPKSEEPKSKRLEPPRSVAKKTEKHPVVNKKINDVDGKPLTGSPEKLADGDTIEEESKVSEGESSVYTVVKPQWLGAVGEKQREEETRKPESLSDAHEADEFVDYKDRKKILSNAESDLESAAPGLILRKKKEVEKSADDNGEDSNPSVSKSTGSEMNVEDAVALLLKHKRGYHASDEEEDGVGKEERQHKRKRRVLGPEKPAFLESNKDYDDSWMPPEGQSGDGRTSLNERLGY